jgi:hypothetical protein
MSPCSSPTTGPISLLSKRRGDGNDTEDVAAVSTPTAGPISTAHVEAYQRLLSAMRSTGRRRHSLHLSAR